MRPCTAAARPHIPLESGEERERRRVSLLPSDRSFAFFVALFPSVNLA